MLKHVHRHFHLIYFVTLGRMWADWLSQDPPASRWQSPKFDPGFLDSQPWAGPCLLC